MKKITQKEQDKITRKIFDVFLKYHLTGRQMLMIQNIVWSVTRKQKVLLISPYLPGQQTVFKASKEIISLLNLNTKNLQEKRIKYDTR